MLRPTEFLNDVELKFYEMLRLTFVGDTFVTFHFVE